ncbi:MAG: dihydropteroate synthase, partial [Eubacterium sp.]|nr:dihydropteroate synthase [Eubacterium sp.]
MIWKCKEKLIEYGSKVLIMGIVNVTPDSFSDGGLFVNAENAVKHALELEGDGADIIDIGAQSTRPGYKEISPQEEWERLEPVLKELRGKTPLPISVDTYFPFVAKRALETGADIIND